MYPTNNNPGPTSRWSEQKFPSPVIPTYIPQELLTEGDGKVCRGLLLRALSDDMVRIKDKNEFDVFYAKQRKVQAPPKFSADGHRVNVVQNQFLTRLRDLGGELIDLSAQLNRQVVTKQEISHKVYFTAAQIQNRSYGAILGARGRTHQEIEKETGCKVILGGRGITNMTKGSGSNAEDQEDRPHAKIVAPSEDQLQRCIEKIELIMSDTEEGAMKREEGKKKLAIANGTYRAETWVSHVPRGNYQPSNPKDVPDDVLSFMKQV